ncbi:MAG: LON peptidase substrate-binding domain-containing protein [Archangiaceae bacterium]|nr:LON peptidase substrate-binding domain-containing protein [Archangiaceae bacterium]
MRNVVIFPGVTVELSCGREVSIAAVRSAATADEHTLVVLLQRDPEEDVVDSADLYEIGVRCELIDAARASPEVASVLVRAIERVRARVTRQGEALLADVEPLGFNPCVKPLEPELDGWVKAFAREVLGRELGAREALLALAQQGAQHGAVPLSVLQCALEDESLDPVVEYLARLRTESLASMGPLWRLLHWFGNL